MAVYLYHILIVFKSEFSIWTTVWQLFTVIILSLAVQSLGKVQTRFCSRSLDVYTHTSCFLLQFDNFLLIYNRPYTSYTSAVYTLVYGSLTNNIWLLHKPVYYDDSSLGPSMQFSCFIAFFEKVPNYSIF